MIEALAAAVLVAGQPGPPPPVRVVGRVVNREDSAAALGGVRVVLHRIAPAVQGPVDTVATDRGGRFEFRFARDTAATYLVSARYAGIEYFSPPVAGGRIAIDTALRLVVYDTSSTAPVVTSVRTIVVGAPDASGARAVVDWFVLTNRTMFTRVGRDSTDPTWRAGLPPDARNASVGDARLSQISPEAVEFRGDTIAVTAPISPGDKQLLLQYDFGPTIRTAGYPAERADSVDVFLEEPGAAVAGPGWVARDSARFEGRFFRRFSHAGTDPFTVTITLPGGDRLPPWALPALVSAMAAVLAVVAWKKFRRPPALAGPSAGS